MTNINSFFPEGRKGLALGLNAGGGNIGVAVIQLVGLLIIALAGTSQPKIILAVYIPLIVVVSVVAALAMDNISNVRNDTGAAKLALANKHTSIMSLLYIGTFGSFIGYSFAFGLVLQNQFGRTPLQAAAVTFIGPLIGSLIRPLGGWLADRLGGARVTFWNFMAMAVSTLLCILASAVGSLGLFTAGFICLFFFSGVGNGSTYKMIPAIFRAKAPTEDEARRLSGALIGVAGAVGAFGGVLVNLAFRQSFLTYRTGDGAYVAFIAYYVLCAVVTWTVYLRRSPRRLPGV
jgi:MFS transporter, NNP family, nitrate/nitrite transporter